MITVDYSGPNYGPEYAKGEHKFPNLQEFAHWYAQIKRPGISLGAALCVLAERGYLSTSKIEVHSDFFIRGYEERMELEARTGIIKWKGGGYTYINDLRVGIEFAREVDKLAQRKEIAT